VSGARRRAAAALRGLLAALGLGALGAGLAGCGYSTGQVITVERRSVGVEIFDNGSREPDLERDLHLVLSRSVRDLVHAPLVAPAEAELRLQGGILEYRRRGGIRSADNELLETGVGLTVEARLVDREGVVLATSRPGTVWVGYLVDEVEGEVDARDRALRNIADRIVLDLFTALD
jgi:hypothetical protein